MLSALDTNWLGPCNNNFKEVVNHFCLDRQPAPVSTWTVVHGAWVALSKVVVRGDSSVHLT